MNELTTVSTEQIDLIRTTIAKDASPAELKLFLYDCARQGVHPLDKLVHFTKRGGRYVPITSIDFLRRQAGSTGAYAGADDGVFTGEPAKAGFACKLVVYRLVQGVRCEWSATARWEEYYPGDRGGEMWRKMPHVMLSKVAEALALRKAFADVLHGLYTKEEMDQAGGEKPAKDTRSLKEKLGVVVEPNDPTPLMDYAGIVNEVFPGADVTVQPVAPQEGFCVNPPEYAVHQWPLEAGPACTATMKNGVEVVPDGFPVGKHKGDAMDVIPASYLKWASENMTNQQARNMAVTELERRAEVGA